MSSGQKPRTPVHFPKMKHRARKRVAYVTIDMTDWLKLGEAASAAEAPFNRLSNSFEALAARGARLLAELLDEKEQQ